MRTMPLDEYIAWMFAERRYDVDIHTAEVWNTRFQRRLKATRDPLGYGAVGLVFSKRVIRTCRVHRMVAIKAWGLDSVKGKEVGHLNGVQNGDHIDNLWIPESRAEHVRFDDSHRGLKRGPKTTWLPCVECGQENGPIEGHCVTPTRLSGKRFGIDGKLCRICYDRLKHQARLAAA